MGVKSLWAAQARAITAPSPQWIRTNIHRRLPNAALREGNQRDGCDYSLSCEVDLGPSIVRWGPARSSAWRI